MVKSGQELRGFRSPMGSPVYYGEQQPKVMPEDLQELDSGSETSSAVVLASPTAKHSNARKKLKAAGQGILFTKPAIFKKNICGDLFGSR